MLLLASLVLLGCDEVVQDEVPLDTDEVAGFSCPAHSGLSEVGAWWTYQEHEGQGAYTMDWEGTVTSIEEVEQGLLVTVEAESTFAGPGTTQVRHRTSSYRCDAEGLWILEEHEEYSLTDTENHVEGTLGWVWDEPELRLTATLEPGDSWTSHWTKRFINEGQSEGTVEGSTRVEVLEPMEITVPAGTFEAIGVERTMNDFTIAPDWVSPGPGVLVEGMYDIELVDFG